jgi:hypothetical protein
MTSATVLATHPRWLIYHFPTEVGGAAGDSAALACSKGSHYHVRSSSYARARAAVLGAVSVAMNHSHRP